MGKHEGWFKVIAALISGAALVVAALINNSPKDPPPREPAFKPTQDVAVEVSTPTESSIIIPETRPSFVITNKLISPVEISEDGIYKGTIEKSSTTTFLLDNYPVNIQWVVVKKRTTIGVRLGDDMSGEYDGVTTGDSLTIENKVANEQFYFYPIINNNTDKTCHVIINEGWESENDTKSFIAPYASDIGFGYYKLYSNSNVTLDCDGAIYLWGDSPERATGTALFDLAEQETGVVEVTLLP
jgi:hypothetical protein